MVDKRIEAGRKGRQSGLDYEGVLQEKFSGREPEDKKDIWGKIKTRAKTDLIIGSSNYSIKNPKAPSTSTQIQVCSTNRFHKLFDPPQAVKEAINQFVGNHPKLLTKDGFKGNRAVMLEVCKDWSIDFKSLDSKAEQKRSRLLTKNIVDIKDMTDWFFVNRVAVFRFALATSFNDPKNVDTIADTIWWSSKKNSTEDVREFNIAGILTKVEKDAKVSISDKMSVIKIGPMTLQMKGSGKGSAYHNMQFNMSLNDLTRFMEEK
jgi:hypothetical protein